MYADGSIVPFNNFRGVKFTEQQINDYVGGRAICVDGYSGSHSTVFIKFSTERKVPEIYSSNPDAPKHTSTSSFTPSFNHAEQPPTLDNGACAVFGGDAETFLEFKARHPELTPKQALDAWRAKRRGKHLKEASTCDDNPSLIPPMTYAVAGGFYVLAHLYRLSAYSVTFLNIFDCHVKK